VRSERHVLAAEQDIAFLRQFEASDDLE